jgi:two-component system catabolic regulation response regulator CreB
VFLCEELRLHVLLVEDEPAIAETVVYALQSENIRCEWTSTGQAALDAIKSETPSLILLDIGLPDRNGFDLFKSIRELTAASILFLTSRHSEIDQVLGLELGADDYITKPFSPRVLSAKVRAHLRRVETSLPAVEKTNELFVHDKEAGRIRVRGQTLDLSRYEYGVLALLMGHPERIYSREQLMEIVWQRPEESFDRTVDTHIKTLRQKIKEIDSALNPIKTQRGLGYSFEAPKK